jgi:DNA-binding NarL/FixJ family response regulator
MSGPSEAAARPAAARRPAAGAGAGLTPRQRQVAVLIGRGLSSPRIGAALGIAPRTVDKHAERIRRTLGLHSRAEVAAWVADHRLAGALLTSREHEVADLIARGLTNREMARRLVLAERTVDTYVERILRKLGLRARGGRRVGGRTPAHRAGAARRPGGPGRDVGRADRSRRAYARCPTRLCVGMGVPLARCVRPLPDAPRSTPSGPSLGRSVICPIAAPPNTE